MNSHVAADAARRVEGRIQRLASTVRSCLARRLGQSLACLSFLLPFHSSMLLSAELPLGNLGAVFLSRIKFLRAFCSVSMIDERRNGKHDILNLGNEL